MGSEPLLLVVPTTQAADKEVSLMLQALTSHPTNHAPHHQPLTLVSRPKLTWTGTVSDSLAPQLLPQRILGPLTLPVLTRNASAAPIHHAQDCSACAWSPPSCATPWAALVTFQAHQPVHPLVLTHHERFLIRNRLLLHHKVCHSTPLIVHLAGPGSSGPGPACPPGLAGQAPTRGHGEISCLGLELGSTNLAWKSAHTAVGCQMFPQMPQTGKPVNTHRTRQVGLQHSCACLS